MNFANEDLAEFPPSPTSNVPFRQDPEFIERPELSQLERQLKRPYARAALLGIGGVGKSQIVIEFCHRLREESPSTWVFWIYASNYTRFENGVRDAANQLKITGRTDPKADLFQLFQDWLQDPGNGSWLLVLDNADEAGYLFQPPGGTPDAMSRVYANTARKRLLDYLPICLHGSVVVTTRYRETATRLVYEDEIITIKPMGKELALNLLEKKLGPQTDGTGAEDLTAALEYMPLAISQAATYIKRRRPRFSIEQYLEKFSWSEKSRASLLKADLREYGRDREATNSIILTWQISFEQIRQSRESAADLLSLMSFFDHHSIPEFLLRPLYGVKSSSEYSSDDKDLDSDPKFSADEDYGEHLRKSSKTRSIDADIDTSSDILGDDDFEEDIITLRDYSFISNIPNATAFKMPRLVQFATREWLKSHKQDVYWLERSLCNLNVALLQGQFENWAK